jgi:hypothetical protein
MWKEKVVIKFEVQSWYLSSATEENHVKRKLNIVDVSVKIQATHTRIQERRLTARAKLLSALTF